MPEVDPERLYRPRRRMHPPSRISFWLNGWQWHAMCLYSRHFYDNRWILFRVIDGKHRPIRRRFRNRRDMERWIMRQE